MRINFFLLLIAVFVGCAKPNYQDSKDTVTPQAQPKPEPAKDEKCELFLTQARLCVSFQWETLPTQTEMGSFVFKFYVQETPKVFTTPAHTPAVQLWMPSMGHGSSPVTVEKTAEGQYRASKVFFVMPGEWTIRIQLKDEKNVVEQVVKNITL